MTQEQLELLREYVQCEIQNALGYRIDAFLTHDKIEATKIAFENLVASFSEDQK